MDSMLNSKRADPHDVPLVAPDIVPVAHADSALSDLPRDATRRSAAPQAQPRSDFAAGASIPPVDTTFRPANADDVQIRRDRRRSIGVRVMRGVIGFLL